MFKKGHRAHNRGDTYVKANYREMPDKDDMEERIMARGNNPFKLNINMSDLSTSKNTLRSNRVDLF